MGMVGRKSPLRKLASELARLTGETKTDVFTKALRERLEQVHRARAKGREVADEIDEVALHCAALPVLDQRTADEIVGYDENGSRNDHTGLLSSIGQRTSRSRSLSPRNDLKPRSNVVTS